MKEEIDVMTWEPLVQADQVTVEASTAAQRVAASVLACAAVVLAAPGGIGVPSPRAESVTIKVEVGEKGSRTPKIPRHRQPNVFTRSFSRR